MLLKVNAQKAAALNTVNFNIIQMISSHCCSSNCKKIVIVFLFSDNNTENIVIDKLNW